MKRLKLAVMALFTFVAVSNVSAQDENNPWVVGFGVNTVDFIFEDLGETGHFKDLFNVGDWNVLPSISRISAEKYLDKGFTLQLAGTLNKIETFLVEDDSDFLYYSIDGVVKYDLNNIFGQTGWFDPYLHLGGSYVNANDNGEGMIGYGAGFNTWFNDNLGLNFHTGAKQGFSDNVQSHWQHSLGLVVKFGGKDTDGDGVYDKNDACPEVAGLKEFNGCPDADGDGIKDSEDACPNAAGLAEMNGCPDADGDGVADKDDMCPNAKGTKANKGCPDTDGDGVLDKDDKCANVAGPSANGGCPWPDTDGDGVLDKDDKCPNEAGVASNNGCKEVSMKDAELMDFYAKSILFNTGKSSFKAGITKQLDNVYEVMSKYTNASFTISGHTDSVGRASTNLKLSEKRANAVRDYLISKGMDASRLTAKGYGETSPIDSNKTRKGRANNRRVEIKTVK